MCLRAACNDGGGEQLLLASIGFLDFFNLLKPLKDFMQCVLSSLHLLQMADKDLELHWMVNPTVLCWR
jgi:hypothetical protein